jgi:hypothetical protein
MKKIIFFSIALIIFSGIGIGVFQFYKCGGNLTFYVSNVSEIDSVRIEMYIDNKLLNNKTYSNTQFGYFHLSFFVPLGKHNCCLKAYNNKNELIKQSVFKFSIIMKWVIVEFQDEYIYYGDTFSDNYSRKNVFQFLFDERWSPITHID